MGKTWTYELTTGSDAPRKGRVAIEKALGERVERRIVELAKLVVSELITNVVLHTDSKRVCVKLAVDDRLRIEVRNRGRPFDPARAPAGGRGGWGLPIVDELSDRWGVATGPEICVWSEIALAPNSA